MKVFHRLCRTLKRDQSYDAICLLATALKRLKEITLTVLDFEEIILVFMWMVPLQKKLYGPPWAEPWHNTKSAQEWLNRLKCPNIIVHLWDAIVWSPETTDTDPLGLLTVLCQELHTMRQVVLMSWQIAVFLDQPCAGGGGAGLTLSDAT